MRLFRRASGATGNRTSELIEKFNKIDIDCCLISRSSWADENVFWVSRRHFIFKIFPTYPKKNRVLDLREWLIPKIYLTGNWRHPAVRKKLFFKPSWKWLRDFGIGQKIFRELGEANYSSQRPTLIKVIRIGSEDVEWNRSHVFLMVNTVTSLSWSLEWTFCLFMANLLRQMLGLSMAEL